MSKCVGCGEETIYGTDSEPDCGCQTPQHRDWTTIKESRNPSPPPPSSLRHLYVGCIAFIAGVLLGLAITNL